MAERYEVTSVGVSPAQDRIHRMRSYFIAMTIRLLCVFSLFWIRGWWIVLVGIGAVVLPMFAVLIANAVSHNGGQNPDSPTPHQLKPGSQSGDSAQQATDQQVIVVDMFSERRHSNDSTPAERGNE